MINRREFVIGTLGASFISQATAQTVTVNGAGATFPAPLYFKWAEEYRAKTGININYQSIGSGAGLNQIRAGTVDFGASDMPLNPVPNTLHQFPTVEGEVVLIYNLPGRPTVKTTINMASRIFSGEIQMWNEVYADLPRLPIVPIYRADGSGTTFIWTSAMKAHGQWNDVGTSVRWPAGQGARGNEGVAATVSRVRGAVGYVEYIYAKKNNIQFAELDHKVRARTYILVPRPPKSVDTHRAITNFWEWCFTEGRPIAESMHYHPLPASEYSTIIQELKTLG